MQIICICTYLWASVRPVLCFYIDICMQTNEEAYRHAHILKCKYICIHMCTYIIYIYIFIYILLILYIWPHVYIYIYVNGFCPLRLVVFVFGNDRALLVVPV